MKLPKKKKKSSNHRLKNKTLRKKLLITVGILLLCRFLAAIPTPGVNTSYFNTLLSLYSSLGFLNVMTGNGLENLSLMTLSITPYITASINIQLLGLIFKRIEELSKSNIQDDRKKIEIATYVMGGAVGFIEAIMMAWGYGSQGLLIDYKWYWVLLVALIWTAFSVIASLLGKLISDKGIGNGVSLILLTNILVSYPSDVQTLASVFVIGKKIPFNIIATVILIFVVFALFAFTYVLQTAEKQIPVNYPGKGTSVSQGKHTSNIPIKLCPGGVVPIIFASTILTLPVLIVTSFGGTENAILKFTDSSYWFSIKTPWYSLGYLVYALMIFGFSYYYTNITVNPIEIANKIKKAGGNISGIRAGKATADYLKTRMHNMVAIGAICLIIIATVPSVLVGVWNVSGISFLGTSIIITVGVITDTIKQIKTEALQHTYAKRVKKGGLFGA